MFCFCQPQLPCSVLTQRPSSPRWVKTRLWSADLELHPNPGSLGGKVTENSRAVGGETSLRFRTNPPQLVCLNVFISVHTFTFICADRILNQCLRCWLRRLWACGHAAECLSTLSKQPWGFTSAVFTVQTRSPWSVWIHYDYRFLTSLIILNNRAGFSRNVTMTTRNVWVGSACSTS